MNTPNSFLAVFQRLLGIKHATLYEVGIQSMEKKKEWNEKPY
jgi:hypothetical protein